MKIIFGLLIFIITSVISGIFIGMYIPFLIYHYDDKTTADFIWGMFNNPISLEVPMSGWLSLIFSLVTFVNFYSLFTAIGMLKHKEPE